MSLVALSKASSSEAGTESEVEGMARRQKKKSPKMRIRMEAAMRRNRRASARRQGCCCFGPGCEYLLEASHVDGAQAVGRAVVAQLAVTVWKPAPVIR